MPCVWQFSIGKMDLKMPVGAAPNTSEWSKNLLLTEVQIISEVWRYFIDKMYLKMQFVWSWPFVEGLCVNGRRTNEGNHEANVIKNRLYQTSTKHDDARTLCMIRGMYFRIVDFSKYRQTSNISGTLAGNKIVDHSDVVRSTPVGAAPTTSLFST